MKTNEDTINIIEVQMANRPFNFAIGKPVIELEQRTTHLYGINILC